MIIGLIRQPAYSRTLNNLYLNRSNTRTNPHSAVNNSSPSDEEYDNDDDDDVDVAERGMHMTKSTYSIKNILNSFNLDNRQTSSMNVFCCGDNSSVGQSKKKLLPNRKVPGQVVQVVTSESGMEVSTEIQRSVDGRNESDAKKKRRTDAVNV